MDYKNRAQRIESMAIKEAILKANHIVLTVHIHPDGDALGSMLALYEYIIGLNKDVQMIVDDVLPEKFMGMPYVDRIIAPKEVKNKDDVDLLIVLDASTFERIGRLGTMFNCPIINIDHHISNSKYANFLYLDAKAAATGEILMDLLTDWGALITPTMGDAMYLAIATDCGFFKFENTKGKTLAAAAKCVESGARPQHISSLVDMSTENRLRAIGLALQTVRFYCNGKVASIVVNREIMKLVNEDTDGFVDFIRCVEGVDVAILFKEYSEKHIRVSFRSKHADVNQIASNFGGGGHIRAAGCTVKSFLEEAIPEVITVVEQYFSKEA